MDISSLQRGVKATPLPLEKLASNSQLSKSEKLAEASRQFEAVLLRQILGESQKPLFKSKAAGSSVTSDIYHDLVNKEMAEQMSRSGTVGLARSLESQLKRQLNTGKTAEKPEAAEPPSPAAPASRWTTNS